MPTIGIQELLIIGIVVAIFFGAERVAQILKEVGKGVREFREESEVEMVEGSSVSLPIEDVSESKPHIAAHPPPFTPLDDFPIDPVPPIYSSPQLTPIAVTDSPIEIEGSITNTKGVVAVGNNIWVTIEEYHAPLDLSAFVEAPIIVFVSAPETTESRDIAKRAINSLAGLSRAWVLDALPPSLRDRTVVESYIQKCDIFVVVVDGELSESQSHEVELARKLNKKNLFAFAKQPSSKGKKDIKEYGLMPIAYANTGELEENIKKAIVALLLQSVRKDENRYSLNKPDIILLVTLAIAGNLIVREEVWSNIREVLNEFYQAKLDDEIDTIKRVRDFAYSQIKKAEALFEKKEYREVIKICSEILTSDPNHLTALEMRGISFYHIFLYEKSRADLSRIIDITLNYSDNTIRYRGLSNYSLGMYQLAIDDLTVLIERQPELAIAYAYRGSAWRYLKEYDKALEDLNKALELDEAFDFALRERLRVYKESEDLSLYLLEIERILKSDVMDSDFFIRLLNTVYDIQLQLKLFDLIIGYYPKVAAFYVMRANIYRRLKKYSQAINDLNIATQIEPQNTSNYFQRAYIYTEVKKYAMAISELDRILQIDPQSRQALVEKIDIYSEYIQDYRKLLFYLDQYLKQMNGSIDYVINVGDKLIKKEKFSQAVELFTLVLNSSKTIRTERGEALAHRGRCYRRLNDLKRALIDLDEAIKIDPNSEYALQSRALVYWKIGKYNEALKDLEKVKKVAPSINKTTNEWIRGIVRDARRNNKRR